ncbi:MAG: hypothetical protein IMZ61_06710, partial [Planctomycetes bacterium]|nr:hypothetical protein [Planctomycetota bacterium]
ILGLGGILVDDTLTWGNGSEFKNCLITSGKEAQTASIDDNSTTGEIRYVDCRVDKQPTCIATTTGLFQVHGCVVANATAFTAVNNA